MTQPSPDGVVFKGEWAFAAAPARVWPLIADTDGFGRSLGIPPVTYAASPHPKGGSTRVGSTTYLGLLPMSWDENPYNWVEGQEHSVLREFHKGPLKSYSLKTTLEPTTSGSQLKVTLVVTPRNAVFKPLAGAVGGTIMRGVQRTYDRFAEYFSGKVSEPYQTHPVELPGSGRDRAEAIAATLIEQGLDQAMVRALIQHVVRAPDYELSKLRPFGLAKHWGFDRRALLKVFLHATNAGLLDLRWDLLCPGCRGGKDMGNSLSKITSTEHCPSCNINVEANFDQSVEISFKPSPAIRTIEVGEYCVGGPGRTPHVVMQATLEANRPHEVVLTLEPGTYRLRGPQIDSHMTIALHEGGPDAGATHRVEVTREGFQPSTLDLDQLTLRLSLEATEQKLVILERTAWSDDIVTAAYVSNLQEFRTLFASEMLASDLQLSVGRVAILFTDLKSSTAMYEQLGDATAFSLVQTHFRILQEAIDANNGAIVKTVGDAVMASFYNAADCVRASFEIQASIDRYNVETPQKAAPIVVKLGAHTGPCIAVTLNERLDYFGTTVNVAARVQNESVGHDIVLSDDILTDPGVRDLLPALPIQQSQRFEVALKGLANSYALTRIYPDLGGALPHFRRHTGEVRLIT